MMQLKKWQVLQSKYATQHLVTYSLQIGIKNFGSCEAASSEIKQEDDQESFKPINMKDVTKPQYQLMDRKDISSPTVSTQH